jgi:hypothetical protein
VKLENLRREDWLVGGVAVVLLFDLLVFAWLSLSTESLTIRGQTVSFGGGSLTATDSPDGWLGLFAVVALLALLADLALERFSPETHVPVIGASRAHTRYVLGILAGTFLALKFLLHLGQFSNLGFGFWFGAVLAAVLIRLARDARHADAVAAAQARAPASQAEAGPAGPPTA